MAETTKIAWCDATWNPWIGCSHAHTGCDNCYAQSYFRRFGAVGRRIKTSEANWRKPAAWERKLIAAREQYSDERAEFETLGPPPATFRRPEFRVMCGSLMDLFEDWPHPVNHHTGRQITIAAETRIATLPRGKRLATLADLRRDVFQVIDATPNLTYVVPTKRPENVRGMWPCKECGRTVAQPCLYARATAFRPNVHLLYSASDQPTLDAGLPHLLACRDLVPVLGLSLEPLVGPVDLGHPAGWAACAVRGGVNWVIVGGESGPNARPCDVEWIRSIVRQCREAGVACFVKQLGSFPCWAPHGFDHSGLKCSDKQWWDHGGQRIHIKHPKGADPAEWPEDVRVQQYPDT